MIRALDKQNRLETEHLLELVQQSQYTQHGEIDGRDTIEQSAINTALSWRKNLADPAMTYFVHEADGVKGYVLVRELSDQTAAIDDLGVDHASKRQGIGRQLVEYAIDWAKQRGLTSIKLITQTNNAAAAATYRSAGFDEISGEYLNFEKTL